MDITVPEEVTPLRRKFFDQNDVTFSVPDTENIREGQTILLQERPR
jgi:hypothetical protein